MITETESPLFPSRTSNPRHGLTMVFCTNCGPTVGHIPGTYCPYCGWSPGAPAGGAAGAAGAAFAPIVAVPTPAAPVRLLCQLRNCYTDSRPNSHEPQSSCYSVCKVVNCAAYDQQHEYNSTKCGKKCGLQNCKGGSGTHKYNSAKCGEKKCDKRNCLNGPGEHTPCRGCQSLPVQRYRPVAGGAGADVAFQPALRTRRAYLADGRVVEDVGWVDVPVVRRQVGLPPGRVVVRRWP